MNTTSIPVLAAIAVAASSASAQVHLLDPDREIDLITFGSCNRQDKDTPVLDRIAAEGSDVFLFIGDNVYCDLNGVIPEGYDDMKRAWDALAVQPRWQRFSKAQPVLATWDDHDYGLNDAGAEWRETEPGSHAKTLFLDFFGERSDSPRRDRPGIYDAVTVGPEGRRVQFIVLDTRSFRDPLSVNPAGRPDGKGPYVPHTDGSGALLGEAQWQWLETQLRQPADLRILASSIQVVADEHGWETWGNFPHEQKRLYQLIDETDANGLIAVSGDRHLMEFSREDDPSAPYPIWDFTSSGFNWEATSRVIDEPNIHRVGRALRQVNYGVIRINWNTDPTSTSIDLIGKGPDGEPIMAQRIMLQDLR